MVFGGGPLMPQGGKRNRLISRSFESALSAQGSAAVALMAQGGKRNRLISRSFEGALSAQGSFLEHGE
jgi:hypothetical protein